MNVYTVEYIDEENDFSAVEGIFSTKKLAKKYIKKFHSAKKISEGVEWAEYKVKGEKGVSLWVDEVLVDNFVS